MCENLHYFEGDGGRLAVALPFWLDELIDGWTALRQAMTRQLPGEFTRQEWAYLIWFLDRPNLARPFQQAFGRRLSGVPARVDLLARPRGATALWMPNNVSLLGPLMLVLMSLTGNHLRIKGGSAGRQDLTGAFLAFCRENVPVGPLAQQLRNRVEYAVFGHDDPRHRQMAGQSQVRIVFGSDEAARAIHQLDHPLASIGVSFIDRSSQAWVQMAALDDTVLSDLIRVAAIYGQAGCTSPRRVVVLEGSRHDADAIRDRLANLWPEVIPTRPELHVASENVMARQWAAAAGWDASLTEANAAVLAVGDAAAPGFSAAVGLEIVACGCRQAAADVPENIQTVGHALECPSDPRWLSLLAQTNVKRFVPIAQMHHFGPVWDGHAFWQQCFETVQIGV